MVKIIIATHKKYRMPSDDIYLPLLVGAKNNSLDPGYERDDTGDNISDLNPSFCELTGLYWAWKNVDADYIGLAHYRRHFYLKKKGADKFSYILTGAELEPYLGGIKVFIPKKRNYFIETLYSHYAHTHYASHLDETKKIVQEKYPEYIKQLEVVYNQKSGCMFNMMIMTRELTDEYCTWLFDILFELKSRVDSSELSSYQQRFYGRVSEILFNVWILRKIEEGSLARDEVMELPWMHMEKINWFKKGTAFLQAKFANKKYEGSF